MRLTIFEALGLTHFIMDWIFQSDWQASKRNKEWLPLFIHSLIYTLGFLPAFFFYKINLLYLGLVFFSHFVIDQRTLVIWFIENIKGCKKEKIPETLWLIVLTGIDQALHIVVLALIVLLS